MSFLKKYNLFAFALFLAILITTISCSNSDDAESPTTNATIRLKATTTSSSTASKTANKSSLETNDLVFNSGYIVIREIVFDGQNGSNSVSRTKEQIATINYATGVVSPIVEITVPAGSYTGVNLGIELQDENDRPTVVIEGTYTNSSEDILPIRFEFNSGEVFEANASSVEIEPGADLIGKVTFDALSWFSTVSANQLDNANLTDGVIVISETSNSAIFDIVADRLDVETEAVFE
ncbi:hypothetical protein [Salinimicrobium oceani]|uniref:DUF4382 domain-containing protein n=1 Tax=Salinimicrobium oceani TaxID=2722702 RepID=A0ABX1D1E8_9FLAO|nr:hypothetical protein [Salinimicrobium oceani]NJW53902.1 hypothetical protein [Salinimicrobium oceani]